MKTIGLIGGMSWHSSLEYYRIINELVQKKLGGWNSAKLILYSVNFNEIDNEHKTKDWEKSDDILINAAKSLEKAGAEFIVICANTTHVIFDKMQENLNIPILHIADATADKIKESKLNKIGLLGTKHTMEQEFYKGRLKQKHGLKVIVPEEKEREQINNEINNICLGKTSSNAKKIFLDAINNLVEKGAEGIILGCTEIPLVIKQEDAKSPLFDTARIHAEKAVEYSLKD